MSPGEAPLPTTENTLAVRPGTTIYPITAFHVAGMTRVYHYNQLLVEMESCELFSVILLISAYQVARITNVSH
jgi:hypothetical protein